MPPVFLRNIQCVVLWYRLRVAEMSSSTGLSPCVVCHSRQLRVDTLGISNRPNTTSHSAFAYDSVCPMLCSVALTSSIPIGFFSCRYSDASLPCVAYPYGSVEKSHSEIRGSTCAYQSPRLIAVSHVLLRRSSQVFHRKAYFFTYFDVCTASLNVSLWDNEMNHFISSLILTYCPKT